MTTTQTKSVKKNNLKRTTIFLTEGHHETLRRMAFEQRTSMANLIREAVLEMLELEEDEREALKALQEPEDGSITLEELKRRRAEGITSE